MDNSNFKDERIDKDIRLKQLDNDFKLSMRKEEREDKELSLRQEQQRLEKMKLNQPLQLQKQEEKSLHWDMIQFFKKELELIEDTDNEIEITLEELEAKVKLLQQLIERLEKHCFKYDIEAEDLAYHSIMKQLLRYFKDLYNDSYEDEPEDDIDENDEDYEPVEIAVEYNFHDKSIERIKLLTKAEFDLDKESYS